MKKLFSYSKTVAAALIAALAISSCNDNDDVTQDVTVAKPYILTMAYAPASGYDYSYYTAPFSDLMSGNLTAKGQGTEQVGYFDYTKIGNTIYAVGGLNDVKVTAIQQNADSSLKEVGSATFPKAISDITEADANSLVAVSVDRSANVISFYKIAKNSVQVDSQVSRPVSDLNPPAGTGLEFTGLAVVGNKIFVSYYFINTSTFATPSVSEAQVAVYSYPGFEFQTKISDSRVGPIGGFNVKGGLVKDENGNVYAISTSNPANGYSQYTKPAGVLKIASGASTFDQSYFWQMTDGAILTHAAYVSGGNAFAKINIVPRASQSIWSDGNLKAAMINFNNKSINYFNGVPEHAGNGRRLAVLVDGQSAYFPVKDAANNINIYKANMSDYTATKGATVQSSFLAGIFKY